MKSLTATPAGPLSQLRLTLNRHAPGAPLWLFHNTQSTNTEARSRCLPHGAVAVATHQTAGRGQHGRAWAHRPENLAASWVVAGLPPGVLPLLPLYTGWCLWRALKVQGLDTQLKWPNDLLWQGGKLAGILVESSTVGSNTRAVVGLGLNLLPVAAEELPQAVHGPTSLLQAGLPVRHRLIWLAEMLDVFWRSLKDLTGAGRWLGEYRDAMAYAGERVKLEVSEGQHLLVVIRGVDEKGRLLVTDEAGQEKRFSAARILERGGT